MEIILPQLRLAALGLGKFAYLFGLGLGEEANDLTADFRLPLDFG